METREDEPERRSRPTPPLIVAGMHRSGTSMVSALLSRLSVDMGRDMLPPDGHNVRGYFEDLEFMGLQRRMLAESCMADDGGHPDWGWTERETLDPSGFDAFVPEARRLLATRADRAGGWGWKDPRTTLMLDFWDRLVEGRARYVFVYRVPWDVADSMQRLGADVFLRHPDYGYRIWEYYNRRLRDFYVAHRDRCVLVSSRALPRQLPVFTGAIRDKLGVPIREDRLDDFYDERLLRATAEIDPLIDLSAVVWPGCAQLLSELDELADVSGAGSWRARPVQSRLARPDATDGATIDVSIVTPCYDQGILLVEAVASAERTAPPNCELIIVNDGSREPRTLEILDLLKRLGYYVHDQPNLGLSGARNAAIACARGRYILPLDDDNRLRAGYIRDAIHVLDTQPEVGVVYGDRYEFGLRGGVQPVPPLDQRALIENNYIDACAVFRKEIWSIGGGYDAFLSPLEDWDLWLRALKRGWRFHHLPYATFDYRVRPDSLLARVAATAPEGEYRRRIREKHADLYCALARDEIETLAERDGHAQALAALHRRRGRLEADLARFKGSRIGRLLAALRLLPRD